MRASEKPGDSATRESPRVQRQTVPPLEGAFERARVLEQMLQDGRRDAAWDYYLQLHPSDRAETLTEMGGRLSRSLAWEMAPETVAGLLEHLEPRMAVRMLRDYAPSALAEVLDIADPGSAAEMLELLPRERRLATIEEMAARSSLNVGRVETLLRYQDGTAGRLIDLEVPVFNENTTVPIALDRLRLMGEAAEQLNSLPVVDGDGRLVGSLRPVRLALARPNASVGQIMDRDLTSVTTSTDEQVALQLISRLKVSDLPVVEDDGRLAGLIRAEDAVEAVQENATEDMYRIAGIGEERSDRAADRLRSQPVPVAGLESRYRLPGGGRHRAVRVHHR